MSSSRLAGIPLDHVVAEMAAFPLASEASLRQGLTRLAPEMSGGTRQLWRQAEGHVLGSFPAFSVDEAVAIRDKIWFADGSAAPVSLAAYLRRLAATFLEPRGSVASPRRPAAASVAGSARAAPQALARQAWQWLALALPPDLLLAALGDAGHGPERIELLAPSLDRCLRDRGFAETHLHLGAALDFPLLWTAALYSLGDPAFDTAAFESPGAALDGGRLLGRWLIRAALARYVLAAYLARRGSYGSWPEYLHAEVCERLTEGCGQIAFALLLEALDDLRQGEIGADAARDAALQGLYAELTGITALELPDDPATALEADPIRSLQLPGGGRSPEMRFISDALAYLESFEGCSPQRRDPLFATLFWQVVRVRTLLYRHVVQRPMTPGLQWFVRFYDRQRTASRFLSDRVLLASAARLGGQAGGLRSLEVRTSPSTSITWLARFVAAIDEAGRRAAGGLELGVVFHFIKDRGGGALAGSPTAHWRGSHADPLASDRGGNPTGYRYAAFYQHRRRQAMALAWTLRSFPRSLEVVRGLDVCTDELGVPSWVMAPLLDRVRRAAEDAAVAIGRADGREVPVLRTTAHAGEDFVHLLTGLRNLDEAIEHLRLGEGDRIGHGLCLGVDPEEWARRAGGIAMTREDRLLDLGWEWAWYAEADRSPPGGRQQRIDREIAALSELIFERSCTPHQLWQLGDDLRNLSMLEAMRFPEGPPPAIDEGDDRVRLLRRYLTDPGVFRRGRQILWVDPAAEGEALARLQAQVRCKLGARSIVVEVNPTSNLLIRDLGDLLAHPIWRLQPPRGDGDSPPVSITIGSDDPVVFGSDLRQEYQRLQDAMAIGGLSNEESRRWLDRVRSCGLESRFTLPPRPDAGVLSLLNLEPATTPMPL